jgi:mRNA interferase MazF
MPEYRVGEIVLVRFHPAFGQELKKYRPALIMVEESKLDSRFVVVAPFTSKSDSTGQFELVVDNPILEKKSLLLCWYMRTIDRTRVVKKLGELKKTEIFKMKKILKKWVE